MAAIATALAACGTAPDPPAVAEPAPMPAPAPAPAMPATPAPTGERGGLPPAELAGLTEAFAEDLAATGTRLTRASLIDRESGSQDPDPAGTHLALYLEPAEGAMPEDYLAGMVDLTRRFATAAFERYPGLASFDVCQVPLGDVPVTASTPFTLVDVTRDGFDAWLAAGGDLSALLALGMSEGSGVKVVMTRPIKGLPEVAAILAAR